MAEDTGHGDARKAAVDAALKKKMGSAYLAAARNSPTYKAAFEQAYSDPTKVMGRVGREMAIVGRGPKYFDVPGPKDEPPYSTDYSQLAEGLRQKLSGRGVDADLGDISSATKKRPILQDSSSLNDLIKDLAFTEALESHEQQGTRFIRAHSDISEEGFPKSVRSMGEGAPPLQEPEEEK